MNDGELFRSSGVEEIAKLREHLYCRRLFLFPLLHKLYLDTVVVTEYKQFVRPSYVPDKGRP